MFTYFLLMYNEFDSILDWWEVCLYSAITCLLRLGVSERGSGGSDSAEVAQA